APPRRWKPHCWTPRAKHKGHAMTVEFTPDRPLLLAGCGNMGAALLQGWIAAGTAPAAVRAIDPAGADRAVAAGSLPELVFSAPPQDGATPRAIVLAVKPQILAEVLPPLRPLIGEDTLVSSVAAGTARSTRSGLTGGQRRRIRG